MPIHFISPGKTIARCARLDIPCRAPDKPQPNGPEHPCPTTSSPAPSTTLSKRDDIGPKTKGAVREAVKPRSTCSTAGKARVAERKADGHGGSTSG